MRVGVWSVFGIALAHRVGGACKAAQQAQHKSPKAACVVYAAMRCVWACAVLGVVMGFNSPCKQVPISRVVNNTGGSCARPTCA